MSIEEYIRITLSSILSIYAAFIFICVIILNLLFAHVRKRKKHPRETKSSEARSFSSYGTQLSLKFKSHSCLLKSISQQFSEDRKEIEESVLKTYDFQKYAFEELESIEPSIQETLDLFILLKHPAQNELEEELLGTFEITKNDFLALKNQLQASSSTQNIIKRQQDSDSGIITSILTEVREEVTKFVLESTSEEKEMFQTVSRLFMQSQEDIRKEIVLVNTVANCHETVDAENFKINLEVTLERMELLKNNLITAQISFNRQCSEMEKLDQIIACFNRKFMSFVEISNKLCNQNKKIHDITRRRLEDADIACTSLTERIDCLHRQSNIFAPIMADVKSILTKDNLNSLSITKMLEENSAEIIKNSETLWINNVDILNEKLKNMLHVGEIEAEKLESLKRTSNNFGNFHNLMRSMTRNYKILLRYFLTVEGSQVFRRTPKIKLKPNIESNKNGTVIYDENKSLRKINGQTEMNGYCDEEVKIWDEVRKETEDVNLQNTDTDNIVFILQDIMQSTKKLLDEEQVTPGDICEADMIQSQDYEQWRNFSSEPLLEDVSSEILIYSSDESTCDLSGIALKR